VARKRREKEKVTDPFERARLKKLRARERREERKRRREQSGDDEPRRRKTSSEPDYSKPMVKDDYLWIRRGLSKDYANRMLNEHKERPYWLSIAHEVGDGVIPCSNFYPCSMFRTKKRAYFGFLFREHRDMFFATLEDARKETTDAVRSINPSIV
jgi:hypothetical protein